MSNKLSAFFIRRPLGRAILAGLVIILIGYVIRVLYFDLPKHEAQQEREEGRERVEAMAEALEEALADRGEALVDSLPARTQWYPAPLPCAARIDYPVERDAVWEILGLPAEGQTSYQYRFEHTDERFVIRARRDSDCDGVFAVVTLESRTDWSSVVGTSTSVQNVQE